MADFDDVLRGDEAPRSAATPDMAVRTARWAGLLLTGAYFSIPAIRVVTTQNPISAILALVALVGLVVLQLRHTWHGLRALPRMSWSTTLFWQALLSYLPAPLAGDAWLGVPSFLAASALILLKPPRGYIVYVAVVLVEAPYAILTYDNLDDVGYACLNTAVTGLVVYGFVRMATLVYEVHRLRASLAQRAVETERLRFARDLHDVLGHLLSAITLKGELAGVMVRVRPEDAERELTEIVTLARSGHKEIRDVVSGYRSVSLHGELAGVTAVLSAAGMECTVDTMALESLPAEASVPLAYALREGATNVLRHSTATWCRITLLPDGNEICLRVVNDGVLPADGDDSGSGLRGLRERLAATLGRLTAGVRSDGAYELMVHIPRPGRGNVPSAIPALVETG